jgi:hypothetical protein
MERVTERHSSSATKTCLQWQSYCHRTAVLNLLPELEMISISGKPLCSMFKRYFGAHPMIPDPSAQRRADFITDILPKARISGVAWWKHWRFQELHSPTQKAQVVTPPTNHMLRRASRKSFLFPEEESHTPQINRINRKALIDALLSTGWTAIQLII